MADVSAVDGSYVNQQLPGFAIEFCQIETAADGEDGVTYTFRMANILAAFVSSNEAGKLGPFTITWSGSTVTVKSALGPQVLLPLATDPSKVFDNGAPRLIRGAGRYVLRSVRYGCVSPNRKGTTDGVSGVQVHSRLCRDSDRRRDGGTVGPE